MITARHARNFEALTQKILEESEDSVAIWAHNVLLERNQYFPVTHRRSDSVELLLAIYRHEGGPEIKNKLWAALDRLARQARWHHGNPEYLASLLAALGFLCVRPAYDLLLFLATEGRLKDRCLREGVSLHGHVLSALAGLGCDYRAMPVLKRDISTREYAGVCFRALWRYDLDAALGYAPQLVAMGIEDEKFPTMSLLRELVRHISIDQAWTLIDGVLMSSSLLEDQERVFWRKVKTGELGVELEWGRAAVHVARPTSEIPPILIPSLEIDFEILLVIVDVWFTDFNAKFDRLRARTGEAPKLSSIDVCFLPPASSGEGSG